MYGAYCYLGTLTVHHVPKSINNHKAVGRLGINERAHCQSQMLMQCLYQVPLLNIYHEPTIGLTSRVSMNYLFYHFLNLL